jgi:hypothetical protein
MDETTKPFGYEFLEDQVLVYYDSPYGGGTSSCSSLCSSSCPSQGGEDSGSDGSCTYD